MLTIRQAQTTDCDAMCAVERAAVLRHYGDSEESARSMAEKVDASALRRQIDRAMVIVAEEAGRLLGFALFDAATGKIDLCCSPDAEKRAIPAALLAVIETEARARGLDTLKLYAMRETEGLYASSGYAPVSSGVNSTYADGDSLPKVRLEKRLVYAEPRPERRRNGAGSTGPTLT